MDRPGMPGLSRSSALVSEALRLARIDPIHSADYSQLEDWAAFQLNGDWK